MRKAIPSFLLGGLLATGCLPDSTIRNVVNNAAVDVADTLVNLILIDNLEEALQDDSAEDA